MGQYIKTTADILVAARAAAALAQSDEGVAKAILSGKFDVWPNVQGAIIAIVAEREVSTAHKNKIAEE